MATAGMITVDGGNDGCCVGGLRYNEVIAILPDHAVVADGRAGGCWAAERRPNLWGGVPDVVEMQSEGGAAGAVHGALQAGARPRVHRLAGLLLMIPNLYKIAGELTAFCMHVAARTVPRTRCRSSAITPT